MQYQALERLTYFDTLRKVHLIRFTIQSVWTALCEQKVSTRSLCIFVDVSEST